MALTPAPSFQLCPFTAGPQDSFGKLTHRALAAAGAKHQIGLTAHRPRSISRGDQQPNMRPDNQIIEIIPNKGCLSC